jgi:hypothetical protein
MGLIFLLLILCGHSHGQEKEIRNSKMTWIQYYNKTSLSERWMWKIDGGFRWSDFFDKSSQFLTRTGIAYNLNPAIQLTGGFAWLGYYSDGDLSRMEYRPYQELSIKNIYNSFSINHRYRLEERFSEYQDPPESSSGSSFNFRFRYSLMFKIPLWEFPSDHTERKVVLNLGNEVFLNAGEEVIHSIFDQNRFILSPGIQLNENLSLHFTWNSLYASGDESYRYSLNHVFWLQVKHGLDLGG